MVIVVLTNGINSENIQNIKESRKQIISKSEKSSNTDSYPVKIDSDSNNSVQNYEEQRSKIKKKILIISFVNQSENENFAHLSDKISGTFIESIKNMRKFYVLDQAFGRAIINKLGIEPYNLFSEINAVSLGKKAYADLVLMGNFLVIENLVYIQVKAVNVIKNKVTIIDKLISPLDSLLGDNLNRLTQRVITKLAMMKWPAKENAVKNIKEKNASGKNRKKIYIITETIKQKNYNNTKPSNYFFLALSFPFYTPLYSDSGQLVLNGKIPFNGLRVGWGFSAGFMRMKVFSDFDAGIKINFGSLRGEIDILGTNNVVLATSEKLSLTYTDINLFGAYQYPILKEFNITGIAGVAMKHLNISISESTDIVSGFIPGIVIGLQFDYVFESFTTGLGYNSNIYFMNRGHLFLNHSIEIKGGYSI